jgi:hypothetical protein
LPLYLYPFSCHLIEEVIGRGNFALVDELVPAD